MENKTSSQTKARLIVITVFVIGFAAGALSLNLYQRLTSASDKEPDPRDRAGVYIKKMNDKMKMNLTSDQQNRIRDILDNTGKRYSEIRQKVQPCLKDFEPQFEAVRQQGRDEIRAVLNENQLPKFEEMVEERDKIRQEEREREKR